MQPKFEEIITGFLEKQVGISSDFLSTDLAFHLRLNLLALYKKEAFMLAGIGNDPDLNQDKTIRSDKIFWLDRAHNDSYENSFFDLIDAFIIYLNQTCFAGIKTYEFHYALYEKGSFYKKHLDQFKTDQQRAFTMIMYLNEGWAAKDGGQLKVYHETEIQLISPENKKCIFFKSSEVPHEVLLSNTNRMSITGWLKT